MTAIGDDAETQRVYLQRLAHDALRIVREPGTGEYDMSPYAEAVHDRHYFHISVDGDDLPERWEPLEEGGGERIRFELNWIPLGRSHLVGSGRAAFLGRIFD